MPLITVPDHGPIAFIHIPKTGGTSVEHYFIRKGVPLSCLLTSDQWVPTDPVWERGISLQHQLYCTMETFALNKNIPLETYRKFTIVRNPYTRIVSDLFFFDLIQPESTPEEVTCAIKAYFKAYEMDKTAYDNHPRCQTAFLVNNARKIDSSIHIMRCEHLTEDMQAFGFTDFDVFEQQNRYRVNESAYLKYLNRESILIISRFYAADFANFKYPLLT